jgi:tetratricopeptide (TPR) repeat protein
MRSPAEALNYLKQAVEFDPNLGAAYAGLGILYHNLGQTNLSAVNLRKAYELRNRLTLRQRLAVEAQYYSDVTGELEKVIQTYKTMEEEYPGNWIVHNNLGAIYIKLGKYDEAITQERESLRLLPSAAQSFNNLVLAFNALDRLDESKAAYEDAIARKADSPDIHVNRYLVSFLLRDQDGMQEQLNWAKGKRGVEDEMLSFHADTQGFYGRLVKARERFTDAVSLAKSSNDLETAASWLVKRALLEVEMGYPEQARNDAADALALSHSSEVELLAAMALARAGDTQSAQEIVEKLDRNFPLDVLIQGYWLPAIRAAIALQLGDPQKAISTLAATSPYELGYPAYSQANSGSMYPTYLRGLAYLRSGQGAQAASEFQKMLDHPGVVGNFAIGALAHLQLARAEVMMGDHTAARKSYRNFLALW